MPAKKNQKEKVPAKIKKAPVKKTPAKKAAVKKVPVKKTPAKKVIAKKSPVKKTTVKKAKEIKATKPEPKESLAKKILAKHSSKVKNNGEDDELKNEANQTAIILRRYGNKPKVSFKAGEYAVYPSHGIGKIVSIEKTSILDQEFKCYLMHFEKERLTIKIPMNSADKIGLRALISKKEMDEVFIILRSGIKKLKGMWSRRAQEYETKINSGDIMLLAEVLRDLTRDIEDSERSYSERIIYETAIYRLACEYAVVYDVDFEEAKAKIILIAKDKLGSEPRINQRDEFDEFDEFDKPDSSNSDEDDDSDEEDEEDEEDEDDFS